MPTLGGGVPELADLLITMVDRGASDLLLKVGNQPLIRVDGTLEPVSDGSPRLEPADTEQFLHDLIPEARIKEFEIAHELDFAYAVPPLGRFRVSAYVQRGSVSIAVRSIPTSLGTIADLKLPDVVRGLAEEPRGLVLITGATGSGKSTTLAAMLDHINTTSRKHVVTVEDPIEYLHRDKAAAIDQREVGSDTESFSTALRHVLRQDPDVILIGEMRDQETVRTALTAAETGHLVLSTLHTLDATETVNRIVDFFQPHEHQHVRSILAGTLKGIVSQRLAPSTDGTGRVPVCEVLTMTRRVHDAILDPTDGRDLTDLVADGGFYGMQTFDQALYELVTGGQVRLQDALRFATHPHDLQLLIASNGRQATTMEDVPGFNGSAPSAARS
jgi:twitching motility protein PilT